MCEVARELTKQELLEFINMNPEAQSILYDLDLLPEQINEKSIDWARMHIIVHLIKRVGELHIIDTL